MMTENEQSLPPVVIYHSSCSDGFCAAWILSRVFRGTKFIPAQYGEDPPYIEPGRRVLIVDFSYRKDILLTMNAVAQPAGIVVLDHHKTAEKECDGLDFCVFDMGKSGARLTLEYLENNRLINIDIPSLLVDYTEDRDLWRFALPNSKEVNSAIRSYPFIFEAWDDLSQRSLEDLIIEGAAIERYRNQQIDIHISHAREIEMAGHRVLGVPCTAGEILSEVAGKLAEERPFGVCWFDTRDGYRVYSLRSRNGGYDVAEIAKSFGGGGHKNAAGFRMPM